MESLGTFFQDFSKNIGNYFAVFFTAMTPIGELRASIPMALGAFKLDIYSTLILSIIGNMIPPIVLVFGLEPLSKFLMRKFRLANRFFTWLFNRTRRNSDGLRQHTWGSLPRERRWLGGAGYTRLTDQDHIDYW